MDTVTDLAQEGTLLSDSHTDVPIAVQDGRNCQEVNHILSRVGDKWSMQVVMSLSGGSMRFNELRREIEGISQRMLTRTLRGLERDGLVGRKVTPSVPPRVDYTLTGLGRSLRQPVLALGDWAVRNRDAVAAAREAFDQANEEE